MPQETAIASVAELPAPSQDVLSATARPIRRNPADHLIKYRFQKGHYPLPDAGRPPGSSAKTIVLKSESVITQKAVEIALNDKHREQGPQVRQFIDKFLPDATVHQTAIHLNFLGLPGGSAYAPTLRRPASDEDSQSED